MVALTGYRGPGIRDESASAPTDSNAPYLYVPQYVFGVGISGNPADEASTLRTLSEDVAHDPNVIAWYVGLNGELPNQDFDAVREMGAIPMITIEPNPLPSSRKSDSVLRDIANGSYDKWIKQLARSVAHQRTDVLIRFAQEANGNWFPWSASSNGNTPEDFVSAFVHVVQVFRQAGAMNAKWIWGVNIIGKGSDINLSEIYPGDEWVDYVGISAFWWAERRTTPGVVLVRETLNEIAKVSQRPVFLAETGADVSVDRKTYLTSLLDSVEKNQLIGLVWLNTKSQWGDWRLTAAHGDPTMLGEIISRWTQLGLRPASESPSVHPVFPNSAFGTSTSTTTLSPQTTTATTRARTNLRSGETPPATTTSPTSESRTGTSITSESSSSTSSTEPSPSISDPEISTTTAPAQ